MFDTHCHLNFKAYKKTLPDIIARAEDAGVTDIMIPGTDVKTSKKAVEIAAEHEHMYAAVGIHPHHVYKLMKREEIRDTSSETIGDSRLRGNDSSAILRFAQNDIEELEALITNPNVKAVGEIGLDNHVYEKTVYEDYVVDGQFVEIQKELLKMQIDLAKKYDKSIIFHNREAKEDMLSIIGQKWDSCFEGRAVFHCCEPDFVETGQAPSLLQFAKEHKMFLGVDGDITYFEEKQEFIKVVPLEMLVLETDSPFLLPEPLRAEKKYPNQPANITIVAEWVAKLKGENVENVREVTRENGMKLFGI